MPCRWHIDQCDSYWISGWIDDDGPVGRIDIAVNGRSVAQLAPTAFRKDLAEAGIGDGRRSFSFELRPHLTSQTNLVMVSRGAQVLHLSTVDRPSVPNTPTIDDSLGTKGAHASGREVLFVQTSDQHEYLPLLEATSRTVIEYCKRHNFKYQSFIGVCRGYYPWQATYNRIPLLNQILDSGYRGWVCYLDADAFVADLEYNLSRYLSDKTHFALIATTDNTHDPNRPYWLVNAGILLINFGQALGRYIVREWFSRFDSISNSTLQQMTEWSETINDQDLLQGVLRDLPDRHEQLLILRDERNVLNFENGEFIRQVLREHGTPEDRLERIKRETDTIIDDQAIKPLRIQQTILDSNKTRTLTELANELGSDKGSKFGDPPHRYTCLYDLILPVYRTRAINLLELGLAAGGPEVGGPIERRVESPSIRMWSEFFPLGQIVGFDISDFSHIADPRFKFVRGDIGSREDLEKLGRAVDGYDIIIDDASHASHHQQLALRMLYPCLRAGGVYIIEDLHWQPSILEGQVDHTPKTAEFLISFFEKSKYIENRILPLKFMNRLRDQTIFAWFPSFSGEVAGPKLAVLAKTN